MQRSQRITFEMPRSPEQKLQDPDYLYNTMIFEIYANWEFVLELMTKFQDRTLKEVDPLERDWLNFVMQNKIDVHKYKEDREKFIEENFKNKKHK
jgi:hypothetical protein